MTPNLNNINAIIFDLGGVILNIDIEGTFEKFKQIGLDLTKDALDTLKNNDFFNAFERGESTPEEFRSQLNKLANTSVSDKEFDDVWNSMILDYPKGNIKILEKLKMKYRTFLMSNTNKIHFDFYSQQLHQNFGYQYLDELFEKAYYSHTSGMRKPEARFFEHILNENGLKPEETLFVDDFIENIQAAKDLGIQTYHISNGNSMIDLV